MHNCVICPLAVLCYVIFCGSVAGFQKQKVSVSCGAKSKWGHLSSINFLSMSSAGSDALGFANSIELGQNNNNNIGFALPTQTLFGSNSLEHGINLIESYLSPEEEDQSQRKRKRKRALCICGWNHARFDPVAWVSAYIKTHEQCSKYSTCK